MSRRMRSGCDRMLRRLIDHIDLRVRSLTEARPFYAQLLPALGFPNFCETSIGVAYDADRDHPKPEFIGLIEDPGHRSNATRIAFWAESREQLDRIARVAVAAGAKNVEGPMFCPEYSSTYYGVFFDDPSGNRLEVCCRTAVP
jgi:predicted enzyme related to lactoylglutathione lyase